MAKSRIYTVIGLMSGTSLDGVDAALVRTDGETRIERLDFITIPYGDDMQSMIRRCLGRRSDDDGFVARMEIELTRAHAAAVDWLLSKAGLSPQDIDLIGFHGQTIAHDPANGFTWQVGNGAMLARLTGIGVVNDFRSADVAAGGQGAPLIPLYHAALAAALPKPVAILNIGGVANVTYIGAPNCFPRASGDPDDACKVPASAGTANFSEILAFDTGPGNALVNDWVKKHLNREYDENGMLARQGTVDTALLNQWLSHPFFVKQPPKSLDRDEFSVFLSPHPSPLPMGEGDPGQRRGLGEGRMKNLNAADGAATLTAFTVQAVAAARDHFPAPVKNWYVTGGGRHNALMMESLRAALNVPVEPVEKLGWNGDALEAEGFAWLAVRSVRGLPLSIPATTGVPSPQTGGRFYAASS